MLINTSAINGTLSNVTIISNTFGDTMRFTLLTFGSISNLISLIIFSNKKFKDNTFKYLLVHSISEFLYFTILFVIILINVLRRGHDLDNSVATILKNLIKILLDDYLTSCLAIFSIFTEIVISLQRYLTISNSRKFKFIKTGNPYKIELFLFIISLSFYFCEVLFKRIVERKGISLIITTNKIVYKYCYMIVNMIRGPISLITLTIINVLSAFKFRHQMVKKLNLKTFGKIK
jgi:uncharacterized membrane protein YhaH (DUF805 family)